MQRRHHDADLHSCTTDVLSNAWHNVDCVMCHARAADFDGSITQQTHPSLRGLGAGDSAIRCRCRRG